MRACVCASVSGRDVSGHKEVVGVLACLFLQVVRLCAPERARKAGVLWVNYARSCAWRGGGAPGRTRCKWGT